MQVRSRRPKVEQRQMSSVASEPYRYSGGQTTRAQLRALPPPPPAFSGEGVQRDPGVSRCSPGLRWPGAGQAPAHTNSGLEAPCSSLPGPRLSLPPSPASSPSPGTSQLCRQHPWAWAGRLGRWALTLRLAKLVLGWVTGPRAAGSTQLLLEQGGAQSGPGLWGHPGLLRQPIHSHHVPGT